jgi:hypothetical protein
MTLREYLLRAGWMDSERVQALPDHLQLFFLRLGHACDGASRFENHPKKLRSALYPIALHKVSERDVASNIVRLHDAGLVKLYAVAGRGYGEVLNFGQKDTKRKVIHPAPEEADRPPDLFTICGAAAPADPPRNVELNRREIPPSPPAERGEVKSFAAEEAKAPRRARMPRTTARIWAARRALDGEETALRDELQGLLRPGGTAFAVEPKAGTPKAARVAEIRERARQIQAERARLVEATREAEEADVTMEAKAS